MIPMAWNTSKHFKIKPLRRNHGLLPLALAVAAVSTTLPLHAADDHPSERTIKQRVAPSYPELAKKMHVSGVVRIEATVAPDGSVTATKTMTGNHILSVAAEDAVHKWKFAPAASESIVEVDVNFASGQ
jgi:TonB family protein